MIVYYADLITQTACEVNRIGCFLGNNVIYPANQFNEQIELHRNRSLGACRDRKTDGKQVIFHSKDISDEWKELMRKYLANKHPTAYEYLRRFD